MTLIEIVRPMAIVMLGGLITTVLLDLFVLPILYLRFGAKDFPGSAPTDYDMTTIGEANEEHVHIEGLRKGDYYIYAVGYDSTISAVVTGGQAYKISSKSGEHDVDVAVTE